MSNNNNNNNQTENLLILTINKLINELISLSSSYLTSDFINKLKELQLQIILKLPLLQSTLYEIIDCIFSPELLCKQLIVAIGLQVTLFTLQKLGGIIYYILSYCTIKGRKIINLNERMKQAITYNEWKKLGELYDNLKGNDIWRKIDESRLYDSKVLKKRTTDIRWMIDNNDIFNLMFRLRGGLARDMYGMQHEGLFSRSRVGTKHLVEEYHKTVVAALDTICDTNPDVDGIPQDAKLAFFNETRHSYGRTALLLSGGAALGFYHLGVVMELFDQGLLPRVISGVSAGSLVAAIVGTRTDEELEYLPNEPFRKDLLRFGWEKSSMSATKLRLLYMFPQRLQWIGDLLFGTLIDNKSLLKLDTNHLKEAIIENTGPYTFQEAFDRTGRILNITIPPINTYDPPRLLNYLTAPHICVWSAALASCHIPGVFDHTPLVVKEPNGEFRSENEWTRGGPGSDIDDHNHNHHHTTTNGSVENELPMNQLSELFNVNHFIVSQVNPNSALFSTLSVDANVATSPIFWAVGGILRFLKSQCRDWLKSLTDLLVYRSVSSSWSARRGVSQLLTQDYGGRDSDITIFPWRNHLSLFGSWYAFLKNPTNSEYREILQVSQRNTWPYLSRVKAHCTVEVALDKCVQRLRKRMSGDTSGLPSAPRGRVPSFYTSRSVTNLAGLQIPDSTQISQADYAKQLLAEKETSHQDTRTQAGGGTFSWELPTQPTTAPVPIHVINTTSKLFNSIDDQTPDIISSSIPPIETPVDNTLTTSQEFIGADQSMDWYNITAIGKDLPLERPEINTKTITTTTTNDNSNNTISSTVAAGSPITNIKSNDQRPSFRRSVSGGVFTERLVSGSGSDNGTNNINNNSLIGRNKSAGELTNDDPNVPLTRRRSMSGGENSSTIKGTGKTTSMANFYYKHAK